MRLEDILKNIHGAKGSLSNHDLDIDSDDLKVQIKMKQLEINRYESNTKDRKWLAIWTAIVVSIWLAIVLLIIFLKGASILELSDTVLATLLGTTTLNVLGLSFIVLKGHFNSTQINT